MVVINPDVVSYGMGANTSELEKTLWDAADSLRANSASDAWDSELEIRRKMIVAGAVDVMVAIVIGSGISILGSVLCIYSPGFRLIGLKLFKKLRG